MAWKERIPGGKAKGMKPSDFDPVALAKGVNEEVKEHGDFEIAMEVAMDHLAEDPNYYGRTKKRRARKKVKKAVKKIRNTQKINQFIRDEFRHLYRG